MDRTKLLLSTIISLIINVCIAQSNNQVTECIIYTVPLGNKTRQDSGYYQHLDTAAKNKFINSICKLVYDGSLGACCYYGNTIMSRPKFYNTEKGKIENTLSGMIQLPWHIKASQKETMILLWEG